MSGCRIFAAGCDLSGQSNQVGLSAMAEELDATVYTSQGWRECTGGILKAELKAEGLLEFSGLGGVGGAGSVDYDMFHLLGQRTGGVDPWTIFPQATTVGSLAWLTDVFRGKYTAGGKP
jgi:hypothetical protein